eukprot:gb/GFBE01005969.1/.p1 GENE.gb/GFBE01005969.1/~~gb/GFBE01005969.1/.p1  ORF type:complete len:366 (+),score=78.49 gb/GFBE01005969.1/:1-1098(+)
MMAERRCRGVGQQRRQRPLALSCVAMLLVALLAAWSIDCFVAPKFRLARRVSVVSGSTGKSRSLRRADGAGNAGAAASEKSKGAKGFAAKNTLWDKLSIQAIGKGKGSFLLDMGGVKLLVNPNLDGSDLKPEKVHEVVDYVLVTSDEEEFFHAPTLEKMSLMKVNFVAGSKAGEILTQMMVRNLAILQPGPGGRCFLEGKAKGSAAVGLLTAPGAGGILPWEKQEQAFVFVNLETGVALGYEAKGQYLGPGASSQKQGIPEEAYQIDFLVTSDLRETKEVAKGLTSKGAVLKAVVRLPGQVSESGSSGDSSNPLLAVDRALDGLLGGIDDDADQFKQFLQKEGGALADTSILLPESNGDAVELKL